ncbi:MAG: hypothetical protein KVP17_001698, partial [Porospora cf. gigantea B]
MKMREQQCRPYRDARTILLSEAQWLAEDVYKGTRDRTLQAQELARCVQATLVKNRGSTNTRDRTALLVLGFWQTLRREVAGTADGSENFIVIPERLDPADLRLPPEVPTTGPVDLSMYACHTSEVPHRRFLSTFCPYTPLVHGLPKSTGVWEASRPRNLTAGLLGRALRILGEGMETEVTVPYGLGILVKKQSQEGAESGRVLRVHTRAVHEGHIEPPVSVHVNDGAPSVSVVKVNDVSYRLDPQVKRRVQPALDRWRGNQGTEDECNLRDHVSRLSSLALFLAPHSSALAAQAALTHVERFRQSSEPLDRSKKRPLGAAAVLSEREKQLRQIFLQCTTSVDFHRLGESLTDADFGEANAEWDEAALKARPWARVEQICLVAAVGTSLFACSLESMELSPDAELPWVFISSQVNSSLYPFPYHRTPAACADEWRSLATQTENLLQQHAANLQPDEASLTSSGTLKYLVKSLRQDVFVDWQLAVLASVSDEDVTQDEVEDCEVISEVVDVS